VDAFATSIRDAQNRSFTIRISVYRILNHPDNYPDTNMAAGNCHAKFNWGQLAPILSDWEVAASQEDPLLLRGHCISNCYNNTDEEK